MTYQSNRGLRGFLAAAALAAGGDGTVVDVVNRHPDLPLAVLPMGTENLLARFLGLPSSGRELAELIAEGCTRKIDIGRANDNATNNPPTRSAHALSMNQTPSGTPEAVTSIATRTAANMPKPRMPFMPTNSKKGTASSTLALTPRAKKTTAISAAAPRHPLPSLAVPSGRVSNTLDQPSPRRVYGTKARYRARFTARPSWR